MFAGTQPLLIAKARQGGPEQIFEQRGGPVFVGVGQRGAAGRFGDTQVHQAAEAAGQPVTNLAEGIGPAELTKEHGYELSPAAESLRGVLGPVFLHQDGELSTGKMLEQLIEQAGSGYDCLGPPCGRRSAKLPGKESFATSIIGGPLPALFRSCLGQECRIMATELTVKERAFAQLIIEGTQVAAYRKVYSARGNANTQTTNAYLNSREGRR